MKHRSNVILILIVAALTLAPRVGNQLDEFGRGVVSRAEGAVWNAFLSLHARRAPRAEEATPAPAVPPASPLVAERSRKAAPRSAAAPQRRSTADKNSSAETARHEERDFQHVFALQPLAPLNLEAARVRLAEQVAAGQRLAVLSRFDMPEIPPDAFRVHAGRAIAERDARRLLRTYERGIRVDNAREAVRRRGVEGTRPGVNVEVSAPPAPERTPKAKVQSRVACAAPAPDAPQPAPSVYVETFTHGFSN